VRAGEYDRRDESEILPYQDLGVSTIVIHADYKKGSLHNDIALLFLDGSFRLVNNVGMVCLPPANQNFDAVDCVLTGWGNDAQGKPQNPLKKVIVSVIPHEECQAQFRKTYLGERYQLHEGFMCAGKEDGQDTCNGDGGSPLVCPIQDLDNRYYQAGIVAFGIGDCWNNVAPGVFANVASYRSWIDDQFRSKSIQITYELGSET
jgi:plasma kallikrein